MTEIEIDGNTIFIDGLNISGKHKPTVKQVKMGLVLVRQTRQKYYEVTLVDIAIEQLDAIVIKGDYLTMKKEKNSELY